MGRWGELSSVVVGDERVGCGGVMGREVEFHCPGVIVGADRSGESAACSVGVASSIIDSISLSDSVSLLCSVLSFP